MTNPARKLETEENPSPRRSGMRTKPAAAARIQPETETLLSFAVTTWAVGGALIALLLAMSGCAGTGPEAPASSPLRLWPENALADSVEAWSARWSAATGIAVSVGTGGTPVVLVDELPNPADSTQEDCGQTQARLLGDRWFATDWVRVRTVPPRGCPSWDATIAHELGHSFSGCAHADRGADVLMSPWGSRNVWIDDVSLAVVCSTTDCLTFNPETSAP